MWQKFDCYNKYCLHRANVTLEQENKVVTDTNLSKAEVTVIVQSMGIFSYNAEKIIEIRQQLSEVIIKIKIVYSIWNT